MPSIRTAEIIGQLTKTSSTTLALSATRCNIGGQQYVTISALNLNTAVTGAGGLDTGTLAANRLYYVYVILSSGIISLVGSLNSNLPSGFTSARFVGYFDTNATPNIVTVANQLSGQVGDHRSSFVTESQFQAVNGPGWILADGRNVAGSAWATQMGSSTVYDLRGVVLRGKDGGRGLNPDGDTGIGTYQGDAFGSHDHNIPVFFTGVTSGGGKSSDVASGNQGGNGNFSPTQVNISTGGVISGSASETRMKNVTANHFVKIN